MKPGFGIRDSGFGSPRDERWFESLAQPDNAAARAISAPIRTSHGAFADECTIPRPFNLATGLPLNSANY